MDKGLAISMVFIGAAMLWDAARRRRGELQGFSVQVAPKLSTSACRASKGGWSNSWATVHHSSSRDRAGSYLTQLKKRYKGDRCVKFRIRES